MIKIKCLAFLAFVFLVGGFSQAAKLPDFKQTGVTVSGNTARIGMTGNGAEWGSTIPISPTIGGWSQAGNYGIPQAAKGPTMTMSGSGEVFFAGTKYPFQAGYTVPASSVVSGLQFAASVACSGLSAPACLAVMAATASLPYIQDWLTNSKVRPDPDDPQKLQQLDPVLFCTEAPCYEYKVNPRPYSGLRTPELACRDYVTDYLVPTFPSNGYYYTGSTATTCSFAATKQGVSAQTIPVVKQSIGAQAPIWRWVSSLDDIRPYLEKTPFDPRIIPEILSKGGDIPMPAPTISGPSSLPGPQEVIKNPDGSTTTKTTTQNFVRNGDTITNITNVTTNITTNTSSQVINSSTSTVSPSGSSEPTPDVCKTNPTSSMCQPLGEAKDTPFGPIPDLYVPKYPDGIVGVWNTRKAELDATPLANVVDNLMPSVGSAGNCPSFTIPLHVGIADYGIGDFSPPCWIWDFGKVVIIVSSLLLARALVFGG